MVDCWYEMSFELLSLVGNYVLSASIKIELTVRTWIVCFRYMLSYLKLILEWVCDKFGWKALNRDKMVHLYKKQSPCLDEKSFLSQYRLTVSHVAMSSGLRSRCQKLFGDITAWMKWHHDVDPKLSKLFNLDLFCAQVVKRAFLNSVKTRKWLFIIFWVWLTLDYMYKCLYVD